MYPKTFREFKQLTHRLEQFGSYFVEKHENSLPECNFSEMTDRFVLLYELMLGELGYQQAKFNLMR